MICQGCGKQKAKGGHRFCYGCLGKILTTRTPAPPPESGYVYPSIKQRPKRG